MNKDGFVKTICNNARKALEQEYLEGKKGYCEIYHMLQKERPYEEIKKCVVERVAFGNLFFSEAIEYALKEEGMEYRKQEGNVATTYKPVKDHEGKFTLKDDEILHGMHYRVYNNKGALVFCVLIRSEEITVQCERKLEVYRERGIKVLEVIRKEGLDFKYAEEVYKYIKSYSEYVKREEKLNKQEGMDACFNEEKEFNEKKGREERFPKFLI